MYTYEDRIKAVRLYLKLGRQLGATIRKLGYPDKEHPTCLVPRVPCHSRLERRIRTLIEKIQR